MNKYSPYPCQLWFCASDGADQAWLQDNNALAIEAYCILGYNGSALELELPLCCELGVSGKSPELMVVVARSLKRVAKDSCVGAPSVSLGSLRRRTIDLYARENQQSDGA